MSHVLALDPGEGAIRIVGRDPEPYLAADKPVPGIEEVRTEMLLRLADAEREGRAVFNPAQTALMVELITVAYFRGIEHESAINAAIMGGTN